MLSHNWLFPDRVIGPAIVALLKCFRIICKARIKARIKARAFSRMYLLYIDFIFILYKYMTLTSEQIKLLQSYRDKSYIYVIFYVVNHVTIIVLYEI